MKKIFQILFVDISSRSIARSVSSAHTDKRVQMTRSWVHVYLSRDRIYQSLPRRRRPPTASPPCRCSFHRAPLRCQERQWPCQWRLFSCLATENRELFECSRCSVDIQLRNIAATTEMARLNKVSDRKKNITFTTNTSSRRRRRRRRRTNMFLVMELKITLLYLIFMLVLFLYVCGVFFLARIFA